MVLEWMESIRTRHFKRKNIPEIYRIISEDMRGRHAWLVLLSGAAVRKQGGGFWG